MTRDPDRWQRDPRTGNHVRHDGATVMPLACRWQAFSPKGEAGPLCDSEQEAMAEADRRWPPR